MPVTINVNGLSLIHKTSGGVAIATLPDVCKTPGPGGPVPVPYPNIAKSSDLVQGTRTVKVDGGSPAAVMGSKFARSMGDEAGAAGGVVSQVVGMEAAFLSFSPSVMLDGKPACRLTDKMLMNKGNTACLGGALNPPVSSFPGAGEPLMSMKGEAPLMSVPPPEAPKRCGVGGVQLTCGHGTRTFVYDAAKHGGDRFHLVLKGGTPETLAVRFNTHCDAGAASCPKLVLVAPDGAVSELGATREVKIAPPASRLPWDNWWELAHAIFVPTRPPMQLYRLRFVSCRDELLQEISIAAHQHVKWEGSFEIGYAHAMSTVTIVQRKSRREAERERRQREQNGMPGLIREDIVTTKKSLFELDPVAQWTVTGKLTVEYGRDKYELSHALKHEVDARNADPLTEGLFRFLRTHLGRLGLFFQKVRAHGLLGGVEPRWPKFIMSGKVELTEDVDGPWARPVGTVRIAFDPLLGAQLKFDCFNFMIDVGSTFLGPGGRVLAAVLKRIRAMLAKGSQGKKFGGKVDIRLDFIVGGDAKAEISVLLGRKSEFGPETGVHGGVDFSLVGKILGVGRAWKFVVIGALEAGLRGKDGLTASRLSTGYKQGAKGMNWTVGWNGLGLSYSLYVELGVGGEEAKAPPAPNVEDTRNPKRVVAKDGESADEAKKRHDAEQADEMKKRAADTRKRLAAKHKGEVEIKKENTSKHRNRLIDEQGVAVLFEGFTWPPPAAAAAATKPDDALLRLLAAADDA